jgi:hypothetical protein
MTTHDPNLLEQASKDRALASIVLFKHRHPQAEAAMHVEMMDLFFSADRLIQLEAFRGAGKTTKLEEALILAGCFATYPYMLLVGEIFDKACQRLASIDRELRMNTELHRLFGGKVLARKSNVDRIWFLSGAVLQAVGWDQELQSFKEGTQRPVLAALDDIENKEGVRDKRAVDEAEEKLYDELIPAMDQTFYKIINAQTRLAEDCIVTRKAKDPEWVYRGYPICNGDPDDPRTTAAWPARYPMEWIRREKRLYAHRLGAFKRVYMLQAVAPESKPFRNAKFPVAPDLRAGYWMPRYATYDPARTTNTRRIRRQGEAIDVSARTGKIVASRFGSQIIIFESGGYFWKPSELIADLFVTDDMHRPVKMGVERNSLDDWLMEPARLEMLRRHQILPLFPMLAPLDRSKDEFILTLVGFFETGEIVLVGGRDAHPDLVAEVEAYPHGSVDVLNALAHALRIFPGSPVYEDFNGSNIDEAPTPKRRETVHVAFNATPAEIVALACIVEGRRLHVAFDCAAHGSLVDIARDIAFTLRTRFPDATLQGWVPAELFEQQQRVPLVPALRAAKIPVSRGEYTTLARGTLSDRIRNEWRQKKMLLVDRAAALALNALAAGYALPVEKGGRTGANPEPGISRLVAEALECMVKRLDTMGEPGALPQGGRLAKAKDGQYMTINPHARAGS